MTAWILAKAVLGPPFALATVRVIEVARELGRQVGLNGVREAEVIGPTNAPSIMIGGRAAELIKAAR